MNRELKAKIILENESQWKFSKKIGVHDSYVSKVVRGARDLSDAEKRKWAEALNCSVQEIFSE
jgi:hypothetical protein